jgi:hypothetical protein
MTKKYTIAISEFAHRIDHDCRVLDKVHCRYVGEGPAVRIQASVYIDVECVCEVAESALHVVACVANLYICIYVCMYVCMCACMCLCINIFLCVCRYVCVHLWI